MDALLRTDEKDKPPKPIAFTIGNVEPEQSRAQTPGCVPERLMKQKAEVCIYLEGLSFELKNRNSMVSSNNKQYWALRINTSLYTSNAVLSSRWIQRKCFEGNWKLNEGESLISQDEQGKPVVIQPYSSNESKRTGKLRWLDNRLNESDDWHMQINGNALEREKILFTGKKRNLNYWIIF